MGRNAIETVLGAVVLIVAGVFLFFAFNVAQVKAVTGYEIKAHFLKVGGLSMGSDVRINGIKIGTVLDRRLDPATFEAVVVMSIKPDVKLPKDTVATIGSEGILGGKYVRLKPGQSKETLAEGGRIAKVEDFKSLEDQVGEIIFLATGGK
ncbi:MAG: outer membrane lipid asymmetry maintenance protein MlaD [Rhodospirillales bacterium CG15_BIG_FIL_POST_REV_8_21_14_020_66_15]|nr:MAG: outer membrane lipid asymmetry maintenance protein MlaD [Rhodospirillales bacterium CG15_BIG_FIL_POST_REV_8_21_14_020_66_15]